jgi:nucleoside-diphosphate-sugar epimerase
VAGRVFNIACGRRSTLLDLVHYLNAILHTSIQPRYAAPRLGDVQHSEADIEAARTFLGYEPLYDFMEGLARTVEWQRQQMLVHVA